MPDDQGVMDGKPVAAPASQSDGAPSDGAGNAGQGKVIFGKQEFGSIEDAGRSYKEALNAFYRKSEEAAQYRKELEALRSAEAQTDILKDIAKNTAPKDTSMDFDGYVKQVAEKHDMTIEQVRDILAPANSWVADAEKRIRQNLEELKSTMDGRFSEMTVAQMKLTPEYRESKEWVDELVAGGMKMDKALDMAKKIRSTLPPSQPDRDNPPPNVAGTRTSTGEKETPYISDSEWETLKATTPGLTDDMRAQMEASYKARAAKAKGGAQ